MTTINQAMLVIYASANGRDGWQPVLPTDVPNWLKEPDVMASLVVEGVAAMKADEGPAGSLWYRAERVSAVGPH